MKRLTTYLAMILCAVALHSATPITPAATSQSMPPASVRFPGCSSPDSVMARLHNHALHALEGVWQFPADGGTLAIERTNPASGMVFDLKAVAAANRGLPPGTLMGRVAATADPDVFHGHIYTRLHEDGTLSKPIEVTLHLNREEAIFKIKPVKKGWKVNLYRLIPYMFRMSVSHRNDSPTDLTGCSRLQPPPPVPLVPVNL